MPTLTIPKTITKGEDLMVVSRREYEKVLHLLNMISKDQLWFWTKEWQNKELEADVDIRAGRISSNYKNAKELKKALKILKVGR